MNRPGKPTWRAWIAALFLLVQCALVARARFVEDRFFSWAPHDCQVQYEIAGVLHGKPLGRGTVQRYGLSARGWQSHAAADVIWVVAKRENRLPPDQRAAVTVRHRSNGGPWITWSYP